MAKNKIEAPHVGEMLKKYVKEKRIFQSAWAREQEIKPKTVVSYFKRATMQTNTLFTISQVLKYNFIREIADQLPADFPPHAANPLQQRVQELEKENEKLKVIIETMEKMAGVKK